MNVNFSKLDKVLIKDHNGQVLEDFPISAASVVNSKLTGNTLIITKKSNHGPTI